MADRPDDPPQRRVLHDLKGKIVDFDDTPEEAAFRAAARAWLEAHARPKGASGSELQRWYRADPHGDAGAEHVRRCKEWQRCLYDGGWAGITWPKQ
jgi:alkylation response protein AidB-like acyl-CoA dehydrogenase